MPPIKTHKGSVRLGAGHSLIIGHGPMFKEMKLEHEKVKASMARLGLFNLATPDSSTFYADVSAEDVMPKTDDYILPVFRGLSETTVRKSYDPIDFSDSGVLKASLPLIVGQTVFSNHEAFVGNEKGVVARSYWDNAYVAEGVNVPAGMNLEFMIDSKLHPKLAREILAPIPVVHSNSVTVNFNWQQSHPKMSFDEFRSKVGTFDDKGQLIRRIVSEILAYHETSLVAHGADPFAQIINKDGKINNPMYANARDSFSEAKHVTSFFGFSYKSMETFSENAIPNSSNITEGEDNLENVNKTKMNKELVLLLAMLAGITLTDEQRNLSEEDFEEQFDHESFQAQVIAKKTELENFSTQSERVTELEAQVETLTSEKTELETFKAENEPKLTDLSAATEAKAEALSEVKRLAALSNPKTAQALEDTYNKANLSTLLIFKKQLSADVDDKFPLKCSDCGSENCNRASAKASEDDDTKEDTKSYQDIIDSRRHSPSKLYQ